MTTADTRMLLRRSLTPGCTPDVSAIYIGELVLNAADGILYARGITTGGPEGATLFAWPSGLTGFTSIGGSGGIQFTYSDVEPSSANTGDQWFNTTTGYLLTYLDGLWIDLYAGIIGPTGPTGPAGVDGPTGPTGDGLFDVVFDTNTGITHTINYSTIGTVTGKGRKFPVLLDDGGITFDYIRTQDIYKDSEFVFSILSFTISGNSSELIGTGNYNMTGRTFTASYTTLGPTVAAASVSNNASSSVGYPLSFTPPYTSFAATGSIQFPSSSGSSVTFTLGATGSDSSYDTATATISFRNYTYSGVSTNTNLGAAGLTGMGSYSTELRTNNAGDTFTATAGSGEYIYYAYPSKFGLSSFVVGGFEGGFSLLHAGAVSHTNANGFTENYYIYRSDNANLGVVSVVVGEA
jgi:hypothetical protein